MISLIGRRPIDETAQSTRRGNCGEHDPADRTSAQDSAGTNDRVASRRNKDLYKSYIFILAAIPAVLQFIKLSLIGTNVWLAGRVRLGVIDGLTSMILGYALSLALVYVIGARRRGARAPLQR